MHWLPLVAMVIASALPFPHSSVPRLVTAATEPGGNPDSHGNGVSGISGSSGHPNMSTSSRADSLVKSEARVDYSSQSNNLYGSPQDYRSEVTEKTHQSNTAEDFQPRRLHGQMDYRMPAPVNHIEHKSQGIQKKIIPLSKSDLCKNTQNTSTEGTLPNFEDYSPLSNHREVNDISLDYLAAVDYKSQKRVSSKNKNFVGMTRKKNHYPFNTRKEKKRKVTDIAIRLNYNDWDGTGKKQSFFVSKVQGEHLNYPEEQMKAESEGKEAGTAGSSVGLEMSTAGLRAGLEAGTAGSRAGLEAGTAGSRAGLETGTAGSRAGLETGTAGSRAGLETGTAGSRAGLETGTAGSRAGLEVGTAGSRAGLEAGTEGLRAGLELDTEGSRAGLEMSTAGLRAGLEVGTAGSRAGLEVGTAGSRAGLETGTAGSRAGLETGTEGSRAGLEMSTAGLRAGLEVGTAGSRAELEVGTAGSRAGLEVGTAGSRAGLETGTAGSRAGLETGTAGSRAGVEVGTAGSRAGLEVGTMESRAGLETGTPGSRAGLETGTAGSREGLEVGTAGSRAGLEVGTAGSRAGLEVSSGILLKDSDLLFLDAHPRVLFTPSSSPPKHPPLLLMLEEGLPALDEERGRQLGEEEEEEEEEELEEESEHDKAVEKEMAGVLVRSEGAEAAHPRSRLKRSSSPYDRRGERSVCEVANEWVTDKKTAIDILGNTVTVLPEIQTPRGPLKQYFFETKCRPPDVRGRGGSGVSGRDCVGVDKKHWVSECKAKQSYVRALTTHPQKGVGWRWIRIDSSCVCVLQGRVTRT